MHFIVTSYTKVDMMNKRKRWIISVSAFLLGTGIVAIALFVFILPGISVYPAIDLQTLTTDQKQTLDSLQQVDEHPLYMMTYFGRYSQYLELKKKYYKELGIPQPKCSTAAALNPKGDCIMGHNSDSSTEPLLLLFTDPPDGYASVSVAHIGEALKFGTNSNTPFDSYQKRTLLLYSPFMINCGMNEMGLAVGTMAVPGTMATLDPGKETMLGGETRRFLLDHAANIDEALDILAKYNEKQGDPGDHLMIADASGKSVVVEWVNGKMQVNRNTGNWQAATNFLLYGAGKTVDEILQEYERTGAIRNDVNGLSYLRYARAWEALKKTDGLTDSQGMMDILQSISLTKDKGSWYDTQYSIVFDLRTGDIKIAMDKKYDAVKEYKLPVH